MGQAGLPEALRRQRRVRLRQLQAQLDELDAAVAAQLQADPALQAQAALLTSIPGVGTLTAANWSPTPGSTLPTTSRAPTAAPRPFLR